MAAMKYKPDGTEDLDQIYRPQGALYVGLYNPWRSTQEKHRATGDIYATVAGGVNLSKVVKGDSVWRLVVMPGNQTYWNNLEMRDETGSGGSTFRNQVERVFNLGVSTTSKGTNAKVAHSGTAGKTLAGGGFAVVGPADPIALNTEKSLSLANLGGLAVPISNASNMHMSVTEEDDYGPCNETLATPRDKPMDMDAHASEWDALFGLNTFKESYRIVHLQRLANPNVAYDQTTNPYITVDSAVVDLNTYNARSEEAENKKAGGTLSGNPLTALRSRPRVNQYCTNTNLSMIWAQNVWATEAQVTKIKAVTAFGSSSGGYRGTAHFLFNKFGDGTNHYPFAWSGSNFTRPVPWLCWLNRTPASALELVNVPKCSNSALLNSTRYTTADTKKYENTGGFGGYLPNFTTDEIPRKVFGYLRLPSMQAVTPMVLNPGTSDPTLPFAYYSMYRDPGKINLNTIYSADVFAAIMGKTTAEASAMWTRLLASRGSSTDVCTVTEPFRSIATEPENSIFRVQGDAGLFRVTSTSKVDEVIHPYFRYHPLYRAANLTTTRSNVFAVWITMGLFERDSAGRLPGEVGYTRTELGMGEGDSRRYRAFYIIDRTIPVGFIRGENYNADQTILLRRFLQ